MTNDSEDQSLAGEQTPEGAESSTTPPPRRQRLRLRTIEDCRREMARVYRAARCGERDISEASKLGNMLSILARTIEGSEMAARVDALEEKARGGSQ